MSNQNRVFLALASVLVGIGLGSFVMLKSVSRTPYTSPYSPGSTPPPVAEPQPEPIQATPTPAPGAPPEKGNSVTIYRISDSPDGPTLRPESHAVSGEKPTDEQRVAAAIGAMAEGENPVLPKGTKLLRLKLTGDTALLDLSKELKDNFSGGDKAEQLAVNALIATAGQLKGVEKVQIFIGGEAIETLGGSQTLLEPLKVPQKK